ncbi:MAG: M23 family metallopeptidase [Parvularculaceae bacterium]
MAKPFSLSALVAFVCIADSAVGAVKAEQEAERTGIVVTRPELAPLAAPQLDENAKLVARANFAEAMQKVEERQRVFGSTAEHVELEGRFAQGGLIFGKTLPGAKARLDGEDVMIGEDGRFVFGFGRDSALTALLAVTLPDGSTERISIDVEDRDFPVERIDGLDQSKVSEFTEEQLKKIASDGELKKSARASTETIADWAKGFDWPILGRVSGVFGSQRILNGEPKTPHSGVDVAAPAGASVKAPADGVVRLAQSDMYFEGGLILIDHGHWLESAIMHLSRIDVAPGQRVRKGDLIGAVGATGRATGPHMHWSVRWAGTLVDPELLVPAHSEPAAAPEAPEGEAAPE